MKFTVGFHWSVDVYLDSVDPYIDLCILHVSVPYQYAFICQLWQPTSAYTMVNIWNRCGVCVWSKKIYIFLFLSRYYQTESRRKIRRRRWWWWWETEEKENINQSKWSSFHVLIYPKGKWIESVHMKNNKSIVFYFLFQNFLLRLFFFPKNKHKENKWVCLCYTPCSNFLFFLIDLFSSCCCFFVQ